MKHPLSGLLQRKTTTIAALSIVAILLHPIENHSSGGEGRQMTQTNPTSGPATLPDSQSIVAIFDSPTEAEAAIKELKRSDFDLLKLSVVGRDYHTDGNVIGYYNTGDRMKHWGARGAFWGSIWGMLFGSAFFMIPGIGPLLMAGPLVATIIGGLEGAAG